MLRDYFGGNLWPSAFFSDPVRVLSIGRNPIQVLLIRSDPVRVLSIRSDPIRSGPGFVNARILAGYYVFNANISFTFQAIKNLYAHLTYLCFGLLCKFFGDF